MDIIVKAARDCAGTVGAAYIAFSLYRLTAWHGHDFYVAPPEKYLGLIACGLFGVLALGYGLARWYETPDERAKRRAASDAERGNVLFLILIAVALFAALSYAVTSTGRTNDGGLQKEKQKLSEAELNRFTAALNQGKAG